MVDNNGWISVNERLPELKDDLVIVYSNVNESYAAHIEDQFGDVTAGRDDNGNQKYTKLYLSSGITHWQPMPDAPIK